MFTFKLGGSLVSAIMREAYRCLYTCVYTNRTHEVYMTSSNRRMPGYVPEAQWYPRLIFALALALGIVRVTLMLWSEP